MNTDSTSAKYEIIDTGNQDRSRPAERPPKTNWKMELIKSLMQVLQYPFPGLVATLIWKYFWKPVRARLTDKHEELLASAKISYGMYKGCKIAQYQWGQSDRKILMAHGWNSKIVDFRQMILYFVAQGYQVEGVDMKAHGQSEGDRTAIPEMIDILNDYYAQNGPFDTVIGYSIGGLATGLMCGQMQREQLPDNLVMIAAPPFISFIFEDTVLQFGFRRAIYRKLKLAFQSFYGQSLLDFDMKNTQKSLHPIRVVLVYDEDDQTITFDKAMIMQSYLPEAHFIRTKGLGHYKVIACEEINEAILRHITPHAPVTS